MTTLVWVHEDMMRAGHPALHQNPAAPAYFIWDTAYFAAADYSLKRQVFLYECLCDMPLEIIVGDTQNVLRQLAAHHGATQIITGKTPNPELKTTMQGLRTTTKVTPVADEAFVQLDNVPELKRFFRYWNKAKKRAFLPDGRP